MTSRDRDIFDVSSPEADTKPERPMVEPNTGQFFLDKFLSEKKEADTAEAVEAAKDAPPAADTPDEMEKVIIEALREIFDPEIPVNIYDMGLIYAVDVTDSMDVIVRMTLTTPNCPVAETMPGEVEMRTKAVPGTRHVEVQLVWDPPWDMSMMTDEARLELGLL